MKNTIFGVLKVITLLFVILVYTALILSLGFRTGRNSAIKEAQEEIDNMVAMFQKNAVSFKKAPSQSSPKPTIEPSAVPVKKEIAVSWGGPELWEAVNKRRKEFGVNPLSVREELCTVASIRLNTLLNKGDLDGHEGFSKLPEERQDLRWIYEKYNLSEFLLMGAKSPQEAVSLWENTLGHRKLLTGGEYVWGCIYAQNTFAVAITAY